RVRGAGRAARAARRPRTGQPAARAHGAGGRRHLPARRRHARTQPHLAGRAVGRRHHVVLWRAGVHLPPAHALPGGPVTVLVEFDGVGFAYAQPERGREAGFALDGVSFAIARGEVFGVIGPNSAGKTTLLRLLTRVATPERGDIRLEGRPLRGLPHADLALRVAVVPQDAPRPFPFSVEQLVLMGRYPHGPGRFFESDEDRALADAAMDATGI